MTKPEKFFSKKHLIRAGWAIIIAIVGFAGGLFFSWLRGPDTINVTSTSNKQPVIVRIENSDNNNSKYDAYLDAIREEIRLLRNTRSYSNARGTLNRESTDYNRVKIPPFKFPKQFDRYTNNSLLP
ncbi:MAG: hypothetical protein IMZ53_14535 [Thermoplasmata archaeon]|nr:hypothetical protein [Thermoplasmata archaeon]